MKIKALPFFLFTLLLMVACGESSEEDQEYANWQYNNEVYFNDIYAKADSAINHGSNNWKIFGKWSLQDEYITKDNSVVVKVLTHGSGAGCPLYTDSVQICIQGRLMPTTSYPNGYIFMGTYEGEFDQATSLSTTISANGTLSNRQIDGLATVLQKMHIGDRWQVYIPYQLGYGSTASTSPTIPAYSTLMYDIKLVGYFHP